MTDENILNSDAGDTREGGLTLTELIAQSEQPSPLPPTGEPTESEQPSADGAALYRETEPWPDPVDPKALLDELRSIMTRFVVLPHWAAETLALWTLHTYAFQLRDVSTYLGVESPEKRCGKTTLLTLLTELVHRPVVASNISSPAFFRVIEEARPTLMIDEADTLLQGNDQLRGILNSGYSKKTAFVVRVARGSHSRSQHSTNNPQPPSKLARFSCWCPKAIAAIGRLPETLADRCIVISMQRKSAVEQSERVRNLDGAILRRKCARFVADHAVAIAEATSSAPPGMNDRAADIWEPLFILADLAGVDWPETARQAAVGLTAKAQENVPGAALLLDVATCFMMFKKNKILTRTLIACLNQFPNRPWSVMKKGKEITDVWLAQQLRPYGIRPTTLWIEGVTGKGYLENDFEEVMQRYLPLAEIQARKEIHANLPPVDASSEDDPDENSVDKDSEPKLSPAQEAKDKLLTTMISIFGSAAQPSDSQSDAPTEQ